MTRDPSPTPLPASVEDVSAEVLTAALVQTFPDLKVNSVNITDVTHGTSTRLHLDVRYAERISEGPPERLFIKTSFGVTHHYDLGRLGLFGSEVRYYVELDPILQVVTPRVYAKSLGETGQFMLVMEDLIAKGLAWREPGDTLEPTTAGRVLDGMAIYHAATWRNDAILNLTWLQSSLGGGLADMYRATLNVEDTEAKLSLPGGDLLPAKIRDAQVLTEAFWQLRDHADSGPQCLVHGDAHLQNFAFTDIGEPVFTDWQVVKRSTCGHDLAYFLGSALSVEDRRAYEDELITRYRNSLETNGVPAQDLVHLEDDYRVNYIHGLLTWLRTPDTMQPRAVNHANLERFATAVIDHDSIGRLRSSS
jgi:hypothetical protein